MNLPRSIISLSEVKHTWDATEGMTYIASIHTHVIILSGTEVIWYGKEALRDDVVLKVTDKSNWR